MQRALSPCGPERAEPGGHNECLLEAPFEGFQLWGGVTPPPPRPGQGLSQGHFVSPELITFYMLNVNYGFK